MADSDNKIARDVVKELRVLTHDLSNALEAILQASYLIGEATLPDDSRRWLEVIEKSSQDAVQINRKLREILRSQ